MSNGGALVANDRLSRTVRKILESPELAELSEEQLDVIAKSVLVDDLKQKLKNEVRRQAIDRDKLAARWLKQFHSTETARSFRFNIDRLFEWLGGRTILDVNAQVADDYVLYLRDSARSSAGQKLSASTIAQRVAAASSFYTHLVRWRVVDYNPFAKAKKPKRRIEKKRAEQVPTNRELDKLATYCRKRMAESEGRGGVHKVRSARLALACLTVLRSTGLRVSALPTLSIDRKGNYQAESKGGTATGTLNKETLSLLKELGFVSVQPFKGYSGFAKYYQRAAKDLGLPTGVHGIRHRFAVDHYNKHKDPAALQRRLGHSSLSATQSYLATLEIKGGVSVFP